MKDETDETLLDRYCNGEEVALSELVGRYQIDLQRFVFRVVGNSEDSADISQKVFVTLFLKAGQFRGQSSFKTWLYQIAMNQCKNHFRSRQRQRLDGSDHDWDAMESDTANVYLDVENDELREKLHQAVMKLPARQRAAMQMRLQLDYTLKEIASVMNVSEGTIKAQHHQALQTLKQEMQEYDYEANNL